MEDGGQFALFGGDGDPFALFGKTSRVSASSGHGSVKIDMDDREGLVKEMSDEKKVYISNEIHRVNDEVMFNRENCLVTETDSPKGTSTHFAREQVLKSQFLSKVKNL